MRKKISLIAAALTALLFLGFSILNLPMAVRSAVGALTEERSFALLTETVHNNYVDMLSFKNSFVDLNGLYSRLTGRRVSNGIMKLKNGMLSKSEPVADPVPAAESITALAEFTWAEGKDFLFVLAPYKLDAEGELLITGMEDYSNYNGDRLLEELEKRGVDCFDLRPYVSATAEMVDSYFYATDHHWNYDGAMAAFGALLTELDARYPDRGIDPSYASLDKWQSHISPNPFMGSWGRRVGRGFAGQEEQTYYTPDFSTHISFSIPKWGEYREGDFSQALVRSDIYIDKPVDPYSQNAYCLYIGGDYGYSEQRSSTAPSDLPILLVKESFSLPLQAYMSTVFQTLDAVDPRYLDDRSAAEYVRDCPAELVIYMVNPNVIGLGW